MTLTELNYGAVLAAAAAGFALGAVWYSPLLFGRQWMAEMNYREEDLKKQEGMGKTYLVVFCFGLISALTLAIIIRATGVTGGVGGLKVGLLAAGGLVATTFGTNYLFENRTARLFFITAGHYAVSFAVMGLILGALL